MNCCELRVNRFVCQPAYGRLGDAEINHLRHRHAVVQCHQDVRRLDVPMNDPLLVRVLDGLANFDEQVDPFLGGEIGLVAVIGDADAAHQFHDEIWAAGFGRSGIKHLGDVGMVHHGQCLPLGLEPRDDLLGVHAQLDDLQRDATAHRLGLFRDIDHAAAAFAHFFQKLVAANGFADGFVLGIRQIELDRRHNCGRVLR